MGVKLQYFFFVYFTLNMYGELLTHICSILYSYLYDGDIMVQTPLELSMINRQ